MLFPESDDEKLLRHLNEKLNAYRTPAPKGLWEDIFHEMNSAPEIETSAADKIIDEKLKTAANQKHTAPEFIWYGIEQKLNLDRIWISMQPELNKIRKSYIYRKVLSYVSVAAILLLLIRGCGIGEYGIDTTMPANIKLQTKKQDQENKTSSLNNLTQNAKPKVKNSSNLNLKNFVSNTPKDKYLPNNNLALSRVADSDLPLQIDKVSDQIISTQSYNSLESINEINTERGENAFTVDMPTIRVSSLEIPVEETKISIYETQAKSKKTNWGFEYSLGVLTFAKSSLFINDHNYSKLNRLRAVDVNLKPSIGFSYAIAVGTRLGKHGFDAEFHYNAIAKQHYNYLVLGRQQTDITELNYTRINLIYKPVLLSYKSSNVIANAGTYLSNLKGVIHSTTAQFASSNNFEINSWETGIILGLGQEHRLSRNIVLDYGLRNEIGLTNVFKSDNRNGANTKLLGFGAYFGLRYNFKK
jgi:hypothetical protein